MSENEEKSMVPAVVIMALCIAYDLSPVDILPDVVPVVGWMDDLLITVTGGLNLIQSALGQTNETLASMVKALKWILIILSVIVILLLLLCGAFIVSLFK